MTSSTRALSIALVAVCLPARAAWAQEPPAFAKNGVYVAAAAIPDFTLDGVTFDGASAYQLEGSEEIIILPRLAPKTTVRGIVGLRSTRGSFEIGYEQTKHVGTFADLAGEATFHSLSFDERIYFLTRGRIQPYALAGLGAPWLTVKDGSVLEGDVADATYRGFGVNTEGGVTVFAHPRLGISAGYRYRAMWFDKASGVSQSSHPLRPRFRETTGNLVINGFFTF